MALQQHHDTVAAIRTIRDSAMQTNEQGEAFGTWLLKHAKREDWIGTLAAQAKADHRFRLTTTPDELRKLMQESGAEGDHFEALDDAEASWLSE